MFVKIKLHDIIKLKTKLLFSIQTYSLNSSFEVSYFSKRISIISAKAKATKEQTILKGLQIYSVVMMNQERSIYSTSLNAH